MRHLKRIILATLILGGLLAVSAPAQAAPAESFIRTAASKMAPTVTTHKVSKAINTNLYSYRVCREYTYWIGLGDAHVCMKSYAARQGDGSGFRVNSIHVYAWTEGQGGGCGDAVEGTSQAAAGIDNDSDTDGVKWSRSANLSYGNGCDLIWRGDPLVKVDTRSVEMAYTYHLEVNARPDPDGRDQCKAWVAINGDGSIFTYSGDTGEKEGPF